MVDVPERLEDHAPVFIYGVEGEQIEEENDAYNDLRFDIGDIYRICWQKNALKYFSGIHKDAEEELDEAMPSCFLLQLFDKKKLYAEQYGQV